MLTLNTWIDKKKHLKREALKATTRVRMLWKKKSQFNVLPDCHVISLNVKSLTNILLKWHKHPFHRCLSVTWIKRQQAVLWFRDGFTKGIRGYSDFTWHKPLQIKPPSAVSVLCCSGLIKSAFTHPQNGFSSMHIWNDSTTIKFFGTHDLRWS